jgi:hypothetical protein
MPLPRIERFRSGIIRQSKERSRKLKESLHRSTRCQAPKVDLPKQNLMVSIWIANPVCTENFIRVDEVMESPKLAE